MEQFGPTGVDEVDDGLLATPTPFRRLTHAANFGTSRVAKVSGRLEAVSVAY